MPAGRAQLGESLAPGFIAAMPQLADPNFRRSVVLLLRHGEAGAFGLVINRPAGLTMGDLLRDQEIPYAGPQGQPVMIGGPVEAERHLLVLRAGAPPVELGPEELLVADGITLITGRGALLQLAADQNSRFRCYLGYAGWGSGQLEEELAEGAWVPLPVCAQLLFDTAPETVWDKALRAAGLDPATLVLPGGEIN